MILEIIDRNSDRNNFNGLLPLGCHFRVQLLKNLVKKND